MRHLGYRDPLLAGLLALLPGGGHLYVGRTARGFACLLGTLAGLVLFIVPGVAIWAASIVDAVLCARQRNEAAPALRLESRGYPPRAVTVNVISGAPRLVEDPWPGAFPPPSGSGRTPQSF